MLSLARSLDFIEAEDVEFPDELLIETTKSQRVNRADIEGKGQVSNPDTPEKKEQRIKAHQKRIQKELKARGLQCLIH